MLLFLIKYHSADQVKTTEIGGAYSTYVESRGAYRVLLGKPEERRPLGRPRLRWEDNIKLDVVDVEWEAWSGLILLRIGTGGRLL